MPRNIEIKARIASVEALAPLAAPIAGAGRISWPSQRLQPAGEAMEPRLVDQSALTVTGLEILTTPKSPDIPALWDAFVPRMHEVSSTAPEKAAYGVMTRAVDDPGKLRYLAGVPTAGTASAPEGMTT